MNQSTHTLSDYVHDAHVLVKHLLVALPEGVEAVLRHRSDSVHLSINVENRFDVVSLIVDVVPVSGKEFHYAVRATVMVNAMLHTTTGDMDKVVDSIVAIRMMAKAIDRKFKDWKVVV